MPFSDARVPWRRPSDSRNPAIYQPRCEKSANAPCSPLKRLLRFSCIVLYGRDISWIFSVALNFSPKREWRSRILGSFSMILEHHRLRDLCRTCGKGIRALSCIGD